MTEITRRALGALTFAGLAAQAHAKAPAVRSAWPDATETAAGQEQLATFLLDGVVVDTCGDHPCYLDRWTGP